jgi:ParB-like chromosome segregation protein Spo0J
MKLNELFEAGPYNIDWNRVARESLPLFMLAQDIKENGIKEPILLKDGKVADGIHRVFALWLSNYEGDIPVKNLDA